jgi:hypothetical protein
MSAITPLLKDTFDPKETMAWLTAGDVREVRYMCWGVSKQINVFDRGLLLKVNARHHKSYVLITVCRGKDIHYVHLVSSHGKVLKTIEEVYCDDLNEIIDNEIERIPQYNF